jgi:DNA-binding LacI/PurR family transcriptional regulator
MATIRDVAKAAGVSVGTVSAALNNSAPVSPRLSRRVFRAVEQVGYAPNSVARSLRLGRTRTLALVISDISNPFFASLAKAVERAADAAGYSLVLCNTDEDPEKELRMIQLLRVQRVDGIMVAPAGFSADYAQRLAKIASMPVVLVDRTVEGLSFDDVVVDNVAAARIVTEYLIRLGHRRIAIVGGRPHVSTAEGRLRGYREAMAAHGLPIEPGFELQADFQTERAFDVVQTLLGRPNPPTAIFAANNLMAIGTVQAAISMGFRCPDDISIAGIDDFVWTTTMQPRLTTVVQPIEAMGESAVRCLVERLDRPAAAGAPPPPQHVVLPPRLLIRESCRRLDAAA